MRIFGKEKLFGNETGAFGWVDVLIFSIILGSSGYGLANIFIIIMFEDDITIFERFLFFSILGIGPIFFAVFLYKWRTNQNIKNLKKEAEKRELALDYDSAIEIWENLEEIEEAARVRKLSAEMRAVKVAQKVVQGDEVTKTEIKDSVLNHSNIGRSSKMQELEKLAEMKKEGLIDDDDYEKMKREIIG